MGGYIALGILASFIGLCVYVMATNKECPYKWDTEICNDCPMQGKCGGYLSGG